MELAGEESGFLNGGVSEEGFFFNDYFIYKYTCMRPNIYRWMD